VTPPGTRRIAWTLPDPKNLPLAECRELRLRLDAGPAKLRIAHQTLLSVDAMRRNPVRRARAADL
jgi:hypothetical protein